MVEVAVLGYGVVGSGTVEILDRNAGQIARKCGQDVRVKYILDIRDFPGNPYAELLVKDFDVIEKDPGISIVVETIGGVKAAYDFTKRCLAAGKSVVTSNKELVAAHGCELLKLACDNGARYLFEASVGGGIPIIKPVSRCIAANRIHEIYGILNGTTNYILTEMEQGGASFADALAQAQQKGYAEADPTADIEGHDACRKICILSSLACGRHIYPEFVPSEGIGGITAEDVRIAGSMGYAIKLLGRAKISDVGVTAYVAPHLINRGNLLSGVNGVMNGVVVRGNAVGDLLFYGAGAGKMPTASAVASDIIDIARHPGPDYPLPWTDGDDAAHGSLDQLESAWYVRTSVPRDKVLHEFGEVTFADSDGSVTAFRTAFLTGKKISELLSRGIPALSLFRILGDY